MSKANRTELSDDEALRLKEIQCINAERYFKDRWHVASQVSPGLLDEDKAWAAFNYCRDALEFDERKFLDDIKFNCKSEERWGGPVPENYEAALDEWLSTRIDDIEEAERDIVKGRRWQARQVEPEPFWLQTLNFYSSLVIGMVILISFFWWLFT